MGNCYGLLPLHTWQKRCCGAPGGNAQSLRMFSARPRRNGIQNACRTAKNPGDRNHLGWYVAERAGRPL